MTVEGLKPWLHVKQDHFEINVKLFQCFISHVTTSETEIKLFQLQPLKLFQNYFSDSEPMEDIHVLQ